MPAFLCRPAIAILACGVFGFGVSAAPAQEAGKKPAAKGPPVFDAAADAPAAVAAALARARKDNQRVLVLFGSDADEASVALASLLAKDREVGRKILYEYQLAKVAVGDPDRNMDLARGYGADLEKKGLPFLTVLAADGKVLANQPVSGLREDRRPEPKTVVEFLARWQAAPLDARALFKAALEEAGRSDRRVLVHLGAPW
jgi:hypothetical protein